MPPDLEQSVTLISSNYPCLEHIFMVPTAFEPLKFYCMFLRVLISLWTLHTCTRMWVRLRNGGTCFINFFHPTVRKQLVFLKLIKVAARLSKIAVSLNVGDGACLIKLYMCTQKLTHIEVLCPLVVLTKELRPR